MLIPHHMNPPPPLSRGKRIGYTPYLGYWLPLAITTTTKISFSGFSREIFPILRQTKFPFLEKMGIRMRPPCILVCVCACGGGGGGGSNIYFGHDFSDNKEVE